MNTLGNCISNWSLGYAIIFNYISRKRRQLSYCHRVLIPLNIMNKIYFIIGLSTLLLVSILDIILSYKLFNTLIDVVGILISVICLMIIRYSTTSIKITLWSIACVFLNLIISASCLLSSLDIVCESFSYGLLCTMFAVGMINVGLLLGKYK